MSITFTNENKHITERLNLIIIIKKMSIVNVYRSWWKAGHKTSSCWRSSKTLSYMHTTENIKYPGVDEVTSNVLKKRLGHY